jgi:hypothetical protein
MFRQIEKLQKMANNLLGLCREAGVEPAEDEILIDSTYRKYEKLGVFILKFQDGVLSKRSANQMKKWIARDEGAHSYYLDFIKLTVMLRLHYNPNTSILSPTCESCGDIFA